jgi:hypothetical protein
LTGLVVGALAVGVTCGGDDDSTPLCAAGSEQACACPTGGEGVRSCLADGEAWSECACGTGGAGGSAGSGGTGGSVATGGAGGGAEGMPRSAYEIPLTPPACDSGDGSVRIIQADADWDDINDPAYRIFCVHPGDYTAAGTIRLEQDGTAGQERWIRYYDPSNPTDDRHPVVRAENERAVIDLMVLEDADYWIVQELTIRGDWTGVRIQNGSEHNVLDRLLLEHSPFQVRDGSHENTLQNSVVRDAPMIPNGDRVCVILSGASTGPDVAVHGTRIVNNEIIDCTDSIQLYRPDSSSHDIDFGGTIIDENDLYLTSAVYSDCSGTLDPQGACACAENAVDIKAAGTNSSNLVQVSNNRMWGWQRTDTDCGGTGSWGDAVVVHQGAQYSLFQKNIVWDSARGLTFANAHHSVIDNVVAHIDNPVDDEGFAILLMGPSSEAYRNVVVDAHAWGQVSGDDGDWRCNTLISAGSGRGTPGSGLLADYNFYYDSTQLAQPGDNDIVHDQAADAQHTQLCFSAKRWTGPEEICLDDAAPTPTSPHDGQCDPSLGSRAGIGVNDDLW